MGLTCREVLERSQSELLRVGGANIPAWGTVPSAVTSGATTWDVDSRQDVSNPSNDSVFEWDDDTMELTLVKSFTDPTVTSGVRGYLESTAAAHDAGVRYVLDNPYPKVVLYNALKSLIADLYGYGLYVAALDTSKTINFTTLVELASGAKDVLGDIFYQNGSNWFPLVKGQNFRIFYRGGSLITSPPQIQFNSGGIQGAALRIPYKKDFTQPSAITDDLTTLGVPDSLQPHLPLGIAAYVLTGREVTEAQAEHMRRALANQNVPMGTRLNVGRSLLATFVSVHVAAERARQLEAQPVTINYERV